MQAHLYALGDAAKADGELGAEDSMELSQELLEYLSQFDESSREMNSPRGSITRLPPRVRKASAGAAVRLAPLTRPTDSRRTLDEATQHDEGTSAGGAAPALSVTVPIAAIGPKCLVAGHQQPRGDGQAVVQCGGD